MNKIFFILGFIVFTACEKSINVKMHVPESKIVIHSDVQANSIIEVKVGKTVSTLENTAADKSLYLLPDAKVVLFENGQMIGNLEFDTVTNTFKSSRKAIVGHEYKISVTAPGYASAEAVTIVPEPVLITGLQRIANVRVNREQEKIDEVKLTFNDSPNSTDYYIVTIRRTRYNDPIPNICIADPSIEGVGGDISELFEFGEKCDFNGNGIIFNDHFFNGTSKTISFYIKHFYFDSDSKVNLQLLHVTEDYYRNAKTFALASNLYGDFFAEPVNVHSNIKNGYGIFGSFAVDEQLVK